MTPVVFDTSAILAVIFSEGGAERVVATANGAMLSVVNLTEVLTRCVDRDFPEKAASDFVNYFNIDLIEFDATLARSAGGLRRTTMQRGLSLGDRACLALAIRENATALTSDRNWADLDIGCRIEIIR
jgi:PIN domain nuclease of toxin-antitoxin system